MASSHGVPRLAADADVNVEKQKEQIRDYRGLLDSVTAKIQAKDYTKDTLTLTSKLLKKNPEYYTIWNHRRRILLHHFQQAESTSDAPAELQSAIAADLNFIVPLLIQYPKCYWIWNYRQWLLEEAEQRLDAGQARQLWEEELGLAGKMLTRDERNFHGWGYRRFIVGKIEALRSVDEGSLVEHEFMYTEKMIKAKLQNFSALHYRSKLLPRLLNERQADGSARRKMLHQELYNMQEALIDPFNQSAWFYHQFLMSSLGEELTDDQRLVTDLTQDERASIYEQELERIKEIEEDFDDCKWVYEALIVYTLDFRAIADPHGVSTEDLQNWLTKLRKLDPARNGRWQELEQRIAP